MYLVFLIFFFPIKISSIGIKIVHYYNEYCMWMWLHKVLDLISAYIWDIGQPYIHLGLFQTFHNTYPIQRDPWRNPCFMGNPNNAIYLNQTFSFNINMYWLALAHVTPSRHFKSFSMLFIFTIPLHPTHFLLVVSYPTSPPLNTPPLSPTFKISLESLSCPPIGGISIIALPSVHALGGRQWRDVV